jgi:hypothetical protein
VGCSTHTIRKVSAVAARIRPTVEANQKTACALHGHPLPTCFVERQHITPPSQAKHPERGDVDEQRDRGDLVSAQHEGGHHSRRIGHVEQRHHAFAPDEHRAAHRDAQRDAQRQVFALGAAV